MLLIEVTKIMFMAFVLETGYITDAENYEWTFEADNVYYSYVVNKTFIDYDRPEVVQVSYCDALEYCAYYNKRLPTLVEYWTFSTNDQRRDVWDWTAEGYLAGGSYLCDNTTCKGHLKGNELTLHESTSNSHIGFLIIDK